MLLLLPLLLTAGAFAPDEDPATRAIVNGRPADGDFPAAVALGIQFGERAMSTCSASLITPQVLLTAAHCTAEFGVPVESVEQFGRAFFGDNVQQADRVVGFQRIINHPNYQGQTGAAGVPANDIGVIILNEPVTDVEPVWVNFRPLVPSDVGTRITSVGFGITGAGNQDSGGIKRVGNLVLDGVEGAFDIPGIPAVMTAGYGDFVVSLSSSTNRGSNVCSGDSGGPQYWERPNGRYEQIAVHSWADRDCRFMSGSTRTDLFEAFIMRHVSSTHDGLTDICEINGRYSDGICDTECEGFDPDCAEPELAAPIYGEGVDACEAQGRYGDGVCHADCPSRDPDCPAGCTVTPGVPAASTLFGLLAVLGWRRRRDGLVG